MTQTPGAGRRERKKEETRRTILAAALKLFKEKGFEAASVDEIVNLADIVKGTFYYHFESKEQVLISLRLDAVNRALEQAEAAVTAEGSVKALKVLAIGMARWCEENPELARVFYARSPNLPSLLTPAKLPRPVAPMTQRIAQLIRHGQAENSLRNDLESHTLAEMLMVMLFHSQMLWVADGQEDSPVSRMQAWVDVLLNGILSGQSRP